ncbi:hypothetical protein MmiEs2_16170 [Methanimicrococcus stummii]|uniref:GLUG domain-containing protein n=1 Tax=Methanimicrococcus stummii TaxID=3028294 RepID=A0AA96ZXT7_9EURY|nr:GLUG motif-containing protein [Methanimicrococcus sp. Es2]WNY29390.1 hypothetical protein MmiEs2_16170 [Methanimicrococcus sp. Es2]
MSDIGLFGVAQDAHFVDINLIDVDIIGGRGVGGLVGNSTDCVIDSCSVSGEVTGQGFVGGISGSDSGSDFVICFVQDSVISGNQVIGGLLGLGSGSDFEYCFTGNVSVIASLDAAGGLAGSFGNGNIIDCYSTADVKSVDIAGGLAGLFYDGSTLSSSYFAGEVSFESGATAASKIGGIFGNTIGTAPTITDCIYLDTSVDTGTTGATPTAAGTSKTSTEMKAGATYPGFSISASPNYLNTWYIYEGVTYPQLFWLKRSIPISTEAELASIGSGIYDPVGAHYYSMDADYVLVNDIPLTGTWTPIGDSTTPFTGTLDGKGYAISDLTINSPTVDQIGLFGTAADATFSNISLIDVEIKGQTGVGSLVGEVTSGVVKIQNCSVVGKNVTGQSQVGGLVGSVELYGGAVKFYDCSVSYLNVTESPAGGIIGGIVGSGNNAPVFENCSVDHVKVTGSTWVGGIAGWAVSAASLKDCSVSDTDVTGIYCVGGLVGFGNGCILNFCSVTDGSVTAGTTGTAIGGLIGSSYGPITNCYSTTDVSGSDMVGGLVGMTSDASTFTSSYFAGTVTLDSSATASSEFGGLLGNSSGSPTFANSYYSNEFLNDGGSGATPTAYGTAVSSAAMKKIGTYTDWSIFSSESPDYIWYITSGSYPKLSSIYAGIPNYLPTTTGGGGGGTGQATVVNSTPASASAPALDETTAPAPSQATNGSDNSQNNNVPQDSYSDEGGSNRTLYILLAAGLIIVVGCVAFFLYKKRV